MSFQLTQFYHVLLDIEGTVAPIHFVHQVLFPYSLEHIEEYLLRNGIPEIVVDSLLEENRKDVETGVYPLRIDHLDDYKRVANYLKYLIQIDRKSTALKEIQGKIWEIGYTRGEIKSQIFSDTVKFFVYLKARNIPISIYSSGSILAQKLIFQYSDKGDLQSYISNYFDTTTGPKKSPESYVAIAQNINLNPSKIVFFTDVVEEAKAAKQAGMEVVIVKRPTNPPQPPHDFYEIEDFFSLI